MLVEGRRASSRRRRGGVPGGTALVDPCRLRSRQCATGDLMWHGSGGGPAPNGSRIELRPNRVKAWY